MGDDGPITSTTQVDDSMIPIVPPTRVSCDALAPDSPWRNPGQVCAPQGPGFLEKLFSDLFVSPTASTSDPAADAPAAAAPPGGSPSWLLLAAAGGLGYYLLTRKKKRA
jgi:hypothetical protein